MLLNLSEVLVEPHSDIDKELPVEMEEISFDGRIFPIAESERLSIHVEHIKGKELRIAGKGSVTVEIPCDRCLEPVREKLFLDFIKHVDLSVPDGEQAERLDETNYIDGYTLDVDQLVRNEMIIGWPTKILCSEDCKGICNTCGQNLNQGTCNCEDTGLDPRMSVIRDVFKNFKEV